MARVPRQRIGTMRHLRGEAREQELEETPFFPYHLPLVSPCFPVARGPAEEPAVVL